MTDISERTADWLGVRYVKKLMNEEELANRFEDATWHCEHHNYDLNYIGKFALSEVPLETGYKVVLTGEGADENFAGYPTYLPDFLREPDHSGQYTTLSDAGRKKLHTEKEAEVADYYASVGAEAFNRAPTAASRMLNDISTPASMSAFQPNCFTNTAKGAFSQDSLTTIAKSIPDHVRSSMMNKWHPLHCALYTWSKGHLTNNFLSCLGDRTEMAHSIEARTPLLDHHLTEYVNNLPPSVKIRYSESQGKAEFTEKWILREAARPFITNELYKRKKHPYSAPTVWPEGGPIHKLFQGLLTEENVKGLGFVDWQKVQDNLMIAFEKGDVRAMRGCYVVGQWVVIGKRFGIPKAKLE